MRVRHDHAGVNRESFASHDPFLDATRNYGLKQLAQQITFAETAVAVLGKGRMIGNVAVEPPPTITAILSVDRLVLLHLFREAAEHLRGRLRVRCETAVGQATDYLGLPGGRNGPVARKRR
jgi:hypothetical protein